MPLKQDTWTMRIVLAWVICFVSIISYKVFFDPEEIAVGTATAYGAAMGSLTVVFGLFQFLRDKITGFLKRKANHVRD